MAVTKIDLEKTVTLARRYGATKVILFGSALTDPRPARDLDIACDIPGLGLFEFAGQLEKMLGCPVDVIPLTPSTPFTKHIEERGKVLYEAVDTARRA